MTVADCNDDMPELVEESDEEEEMQAPPRLGGEANAGQQGDTSEPENRSITRIFEGMWALGGPVSM